MGGQISDTVSSVTPQVLSLTRGWTTPTDLSKHLCFLPPQQLTAPLLWPQNAP